jgi:TonB family protein
MGPTSRDTKNLFGTFIETKQMLSTPVVKDAEDPSHPVDIRFPIYADDYILPVQRLAALQFNLLPPLQAVKESSGNLELGNPGVRREEITFEIPLGFAIKIESHADENRAFARYRSDAIVELGKLVIVRELELKTGSASLSNRAEVDAFWKLVRADQQRTFLFRRIVRSDPTEWLASVPTSRANSLGVRAIEQREYDAARQLLEKVTRARPNDRYAWNNLGRALAGLDRLDEAQKVYEKQIEINPAEQYAYNNVALVYERQGNWARAIESLRKQLQVRPGDPYAIRNLPRPLIHEHRWAEAEEASLAALRLQPESALYRLYAAVSRVCQGKAADVRHELDTALGPRPAAGSLNNAAYYLTECDQQSDLAESYIRKALDQMRTTASSVANGTMASMIAFQNSLSAYLDTYGWLAFKQDKYEHAIELFFAAAALSPRAEAYAHLAQAEEKAGHADKALLYWRQAAFLEPGQMPQVPAEVAKNLDQVAALSLDREWYRFKADLPGDSAASIRTGHPLYFFASANRDGSVQSMRELDSEDDAARSMLPALRTILFPQVQAEGNPIATVHILRITKGADGNVMVARSVGAEAVAIAGDLAPAEFPVPAPATPPAPPPTAASNTGALRIGGGVTPPRVLRKVEPVYSEQARKNHIEGAVVLQCVVGTDGKPRDFHVTRSLGYGLDENAILAVSAWQFVPGTKAGEPVDVISTIEVNFRLLDKK